MEMEPTSPPAIAKRLWNIARIVFLMLRKGISKGKLLLDLHTLLTRGKLAGKALTDAMIQHHAALSCRSGDASLSFISPQEYEFSCSNSPVYPTFYHYSKRKHGQRRHDYHYRRNDKVYDAVQEMFDTWNKNASETADVASPAALPGFGFGKSPRVRQLRITDSPFPVKDADEDADVDKAAEDFINKFYKELMHQKSSATPDSPSPYHVWAR